MNDKSVKDMRTSWKNICDNYVRVFCERHEIDIEYELKHDLVWMVNNPGTIACIGDMFVSMEDLRYDVDNNIHPDFFVKWYWTSVERAELGIKYMNYKSYCRGCPDPITPEKLEQIKESKKRLEQAQAVFEEAIKDYQTQKF